MQARRVGLLQRDPFCPPGGRARLPECVPDAGEDVRDGEGEGDEEEEDLRGLRHRRRDPQPRDHALQTQEAEGANGLEELARSVPVPASWRWRAPTVNPPYICI